jgi:Xaa-Pro aminopeptidase
MLFLRKSLIWFLFLSLITSCTEKVTISEVEVYPEKLSPYNVYYDSTTFKQRRDDFISKIPDDALAIIVTNDTYMRNGDVNFEFRPASNFFYLTGFDEPNAIAVIKKRQDIPDMSELIMFVEYREGVLAQWMGEVVGPDGVIEHFGADNAYRLEDFSEHMNTYINSASYQSIYANFEVNPTVKEIFDNTITDIPIIKSADEIIDLIRVQKSPIEIASVQNAVDVSVQAFQEVLKAIEPGMYEYEVDAMLNYIIGLNGCSRTAFPTIVASGPNINVLHYEANQKQMNDGELVMIDFGAEYGYYCADITRTIPVNGEFSTEQATIYEIVLEAHLAAINSAGPGVKYNELRTFARDLILDRLLEKGIIFGEKSEIISTNAYYRYLPAGLCHPVGLDAHDPFPKNSNGDRILQENMVMAFEPHIYLYEGDPTVNQEYWNISARIEDVVLIIQDGSEVLSSDLPIQIDEIEDLMR